MANTNLHNSISTLFAWADNNKLPTTLFPRDIALLKEIDTLVLVDLGLTDIPEEIALLKGLKHLYLAYNNLTSLPKSLYTLTKLETLNIQGNHLTSIDEEISKLINLTTMHAYDNSLTAVPNSMLMLKNLEFLTLYYNAFSDYFLQIYKSIDYPERLSVSYESKESKDNLKELTLLYAKHLLATKKNCVLK